MRAWKPSSGAFTYSTNSWVAKLQRIYYHYVRLKVFDEKGKSQVATIDIPFDDKTDIQYLTGRTIKADGSEVELKKENIFNRDLVRAGGRRCA